MKFLLEAPQRAPYITGTDRIAFNVIKELHRIDPLNTYEVICSKEFPYISSAVTGNNFSIRYTRNRTRLQTLGRAPISVVRMLYRKVLKPYDAFCSFHNLSSPPIKHSPTVSFALDLIPFFFPDWYHESLPARQMYARRLARARKNVDRFVAISHHTKKDLVDHLDIDPEHIDVVYLAADDRFAPVVDPERLSFVRDKYKLPDRFLLTAGSNEPRKNVRGVVAAFAQVPAATRSSCPLVVIGPPWRDRPIQAEYGQTKFLGMVDDGDLPAVYSLATGFVFLSLYEGFGLPALEAMACGTPVIASATTSVPEVVGSAGLLVDPEDIDACSEAMTHLLEDSELAEKLSASGLERAKTFRWKRTAESVVTTLAHVSSGA